MPKTKGRDAKLSIPPALRTFLRETIATTGGNEVFFLGRVSWGTASSGTGEARPGGAGGEDRVATLEEIDVLARGNDASVPAILQAAERWDIAIHNHPGGDLTPSAADMSIAGELASRSVAFAIISNDASRHYLVTAPFPREEHRPVDPEEVLAIFAPDGPLARRCEGYEARAGQVEMALEVTRAFNEGKIVAAEAGTGIGKSYAYLVPAILWATRNDQRVIVATGTINLQEQLIAKDLPLLKEALPFDFRYALAKGRGNYACIRRTLEVAEDLKQQSLVPREGQMRLLEDLVAWVEATQDGSRADLSWVPPEDLWEEVMSESDKSLKVNCPHYQECFYYRAKRAASRAQIIVANHHLFFADLSVRRQTSNYQYDAVLPWYRRVIFDEAHHLEDVASDYFGVRFTRSGTVRRLEKLLSRTTPRHGVVPRIVETLRKLGDPVSAESMENRFLAAVPEVTETVDLLLAEIDDAVAEVARRMAARPGPAASGERAKEGSTGGDDLAGGGVRAPEAPGGAGEEGRVGSEDIQVRYKGDPDAEAFWRLISRKLAEVHDELSVVLRVNDRALETLQGASASAERIEGMALELSSFSTRLEALLAEIETFRDFQDAAQVRWLSRREARRQGREASLEFGSAPIRVAEGLKSAVYDAMESVVLTSATLSVAGNMEFLADRLGLSLLEGERFGFHQYASSFDYPRQALIVVPSDFPPPESSRYAREIPGAIEAVLRATGGRAFVLFTSYRLLRSVYATLEPRLLAAGLRPCAQGQVGRSELLRRFRAGIANVLFGTDSFWEGVDVKGRALECVIITRLPFRVPSEPVQEARYEDLLARGANPFTAFTVPQAVLKFKQGFGRLIRSSADRGVVAVLDQRILSRPYGKAFLRSLPETAFRKAPLGDVIRAVGAFLTPERPAWPGPPAEPHRPEPRHPPRTGSAQGGSREDPPWDP